MNRWIVSAILLLVLILLSSCFCPLTSVNPLSDPQHATYDERIEGAWQLMSEDDGLLFLHFGKGDDEKTKIISIEHKNNGKIDVLTFSVFPTMNGDQSYLNFNIKELFKEFGEELSGYTFMKYRFTNNDALTLFQIDEKPIIEAIKSGKLKGDISYKQTNGKQSDKKSIKCVRITDSSNHLIKFIQSVDSKELFPKPMLFKKITS
jgi:hypothetical protein